MKRLDLSGRPASDVEAIAFADLEANPDARGVVLTPDQDIAELTPYLSRLELIVVTFSIFRDGRGFTQARALREYAKFIGEIRVAGHVLPDQAYYLRRCGVDSVMLADDADEAPWQRERHRFHMAYQASVSGDGASESGLRRALT